MTHPDVHTAMVRLWVAQLRTAREYRRLSQGEVGKRMGASGQLVWKWEMGINLPTVGHLVAWADVLGFDIRMVPAGTEDKEMK